MGWREKTAAGRIFSISEHSCCHQGLLHNRLHVPLVSCCCHQGLLHNRLHVPLVSCCCHQGLLHNRLHVPLVSCCISSAAYVIGSQSVDLQHVIGPHTLLKYLLTRQKACHEISAVSLQILSCSSWKICRLLTNCSLLPTHARARPHTHTHK
jgi:hypothetical protein